MSVTTDNNANPDMENIVVPVRRSFLAVTAALALALAACASDEADSPANDSVPSQLTLAITETAAMNWDPAMNSVNASYQLELVYDTLVRRLSSGELEPNVAEEWEYTSPTQLVLRLREGISFTDGEPLDSAAVKANLEASQQKGGPLSATLATISSIGTPDATTVVIDLAEPSPVLPTVLSGPMGMMASPAAIDAGTLSAAPVGSGPYELANASPGLAYEYELREDYWNVEHYHYENVRLQVFTDDQSKLNALRSGEVDVIEYNADDEIRGLEESGVLEFQAAAFNVHMLMLMDQEGLLAEPLADVRVRQAMNYAIDREAIAGLNGEGNAGATAQIFKPGQAGYVEELDNYYTYDPEKARDLLAEAGYEDGFILPMISISYFDTQAQAIIGYLSAVGISVETTNVPTGQYHSSITGGDFPSAFFAFNMTDPYSDLSRLIIPGGSLNTFSIEDVEMLSDYQDAASLTDPEQFADRLADVNRRLVENAWYLPSHYGLFGLANSPDVDGITFDVQRPPALYDWKPATS